MILEKRKLFCLADKYEKKAAAAELRFQESGLARYRREKENYEDMADAFRMAANAESDYSELVHTRGMLAKYEQTGISPEMVAVIGWIGRSAWILHMRIPNGKIEVAEGRVTQVSFGGRCTPKVEIMVGLTPYSDLEPENVFLTRDEAEAALAEMEERQAGQV